MLQQNGCGLCRTAPHVLTCAGCHNLQKTLVEIPHWEPSTAPGQISQLLNNCRVLTDWLTPRSNQLQISFPVPLLEGIGVFSYFQDIGTTCQEDGSKTRQGRRRKCQKKISLQSGSVSGNGGAQFQHVHLRHVCCLLPIIKLTRRPCQ